MIKVYQSLSYRDAPINGYFWGLLAETKIRPYVDQKSDVWCVAKLERYLHELDAFVSVIPRRAATEGQTTYSDFIGQELDLARRVRLPRLSFVDDLLLRRFPDDFPKDAVPFIYDEPRSGQARHAVAIHDFAEHVNERGRRPLRDFQDRKAVIIASDGKPHVLATECVRQILEDENYPDPKVIDGRNLRKAYSDVRIFEELLEAEVCVFLLGKRLAWTYVLLAMAHAQSVPSIRLMYDPQTEETEPSLQGIVPWRLIPALEAEFKQQLNGFRRGFVDAIEISSDPEEAAEKAGTMKWEGRPEQYWDSEDGPALLNHLEPDHSFVRDEVSRTRQSLGGGGLDQVEDREGAMEVCAELYDGLKRHHWAYESEPRLLRRERQKIRSPKDIRTHRCANCIDLACLFSSLLMAAYQNPIMVVVEGKGFAHALVGYRPPAEPALARTAGLGDLRGGLSRGELVLFDPTGISQSPRPVSEETVKERQEANNMLLFSTGLEVAWRVLRLEDIAVRYVVDVEAIPR